MQNQDTTRSILLIGIALLSVISITAQAGGKSPASDPARVAAEQTVNDQADTSTGTGDRR